MWITWNVHITLSAYLTYKIKKTLIPQIISEIKECLHDIHRIYYIVSLIYCTHFSEFHLQYIFGLVLNILIKEYKHLVTFYMLKEIQAIHNNLWDISNKNNIILPPNSRLYDSIPNVGFNVSHFAKINTLSYK